MTLLQVTTPRPLRGLARARVLVESFEPGHSVSAYMRAPSTLNTHIVSLGVDAYLKMLLRGETLCLHGCVIIALQCGYVYSRLGLCVGTWLHIYAPAS